MKKIILLLFTFLLLGQIQIFAVPIGSISGGTVITFDTPDTDSIVDLALQGININSLEPGGIPFIDGPGSGVGVGVLGSQALSNNLVGIFNGPSNPPGFAELTVRNFEIVFDNAVTAVGLDVQGWGSSDHAIQVFDLSNNLIETVLFSELLVLNDATPNGFIGVDGEGVLIRRLVFDSLQPQPDAVAFDNLTFLEAAVPEPSALLLLLLSFGVFYCKRK